MTPYAPVPGKIPGTTINLSGREFVLPPLNLDGCQAFEPLQREFLEMQAKRDASMDDLYRIVARCLHLALVRNYPDITVDDIVGLLDARTLRTAIVDLATLSGYVAAGEAIPAAQ